MELKLKQRIIGGIVLICVVLQIIVFLTLQSKPITQVNLSTAIPPVPASQKQLALSPTDVEAPPVASKPHTLSNTHPSPVIITPVQNRQKNTATKKHVIAKKIVHKPKQLLKKEQHKYVAPTQAWVIQVGIFSNKANANSLVLKLQKMKYDAYTMLVSHKAGSTLHAVMVGPEVSRKKLNAINARIGAQLKINGLIKKYQL